MSQLPTVLIRAVCDPLAGQGFTALFDRKVADFECGYSEAERARDSSSL
jgi:hypothetical protein